MNLDFKKLRIHFAGVTTLCVCLAVTYGFGIRPVLKSQEQHQQAVVEADHLQNQLPVLESEIVVLREQIASKRSALQTRYSIQTPSGRPLLGTVSTLLSQRRIALSNLREEGQKPNGELTIVLHASSNYEDMLHFVNDLRKLDCPARISNLHLTPIDELGDRCTAKITVRFFPVIPLPAA